MTDPKIEKMLQTIINGMSAFKIEVTTRFEKLDKKFDDKIDGLEKRVTQRLDRIGRQLAYLEDDAPTRDEFEKLEKKVEEHIMETSHSQAQVKL